MKENNINKNRLSFSLYFNYLIHGLGLIILAQNMVALGKAWQVPIKTVSFVISGIGIGRLLSYLVTGFLSDIFGRKVFVYIGMVSYLIFALGMVTTRSVPLAYFFAILAGVANSALDAGTYTTLVEINNGEGYGTILIKGFTSIGEFLLPLIVVLLANNGMWFGWSFIIMAVLIILNMINFARIKFPNIAKTEAAATINESKSKFSVIKILKTIVFLAYGYVSMALMIWFTQWITLFAQKSLGLSNIAAHTLMSLYSIGSITGVIGLFIALKRGVEEIKLLVSLNLIALVSLAAIVFSGSNVWIDYVASLVFGFSAASGIMQTGLTVFMNMYPNHRGLVTGVFYFFGSIASFTVPLITGVLSEHSVVAAFSADLVIAIIASVLMIVLAILQKMDKNLI